LGGSSVRGLLGLVLYARWHYGTLEGLGIPVMKPFLFLGSNYMDPYVRPREEEVRRLEKYGMVYGVRHWRRRRRSSTASLPLYT
jgi:hypothetical protein